MVVAKRVPPRRSPAPYRYGPWISYGDLIDDPTVGYESYVAQGWEVPNPPGVIPAFDTWAAFTGVQFFNLYAGYEISNSLGAHAAQLFPHNDADARECCAAHAAEGTRGSFPNWAPGDPCPALTAPSGTYLAAGGPGPPQVPVGSYSTHQTYPALILLADTFNSAALQAVSNAYVLNVSSLPAQASQAIAAQIPAYWDYWFNWAVADASTGQYLAPQFRRTRIDLKVWLSNEITPAAVSNGFVVRSRIDPGDSSSRSVWKTTPELQGMQTVMTLDPSSPGNVSGEHRWNNLGGPTIAEDLTPLYVGDDQYTGQFGGPILRHSSSWVENHGDPLLPDYAFPLVNYRFIWHGQVRFPKPRGAPPLRQVQTRGWHSGSPAGKSSARQHSTRQTGYY